MGISSRRGSPNRGQWSVRVEETGRPSQLGFLEQRTRERRALWTGRTGKRKRGKVLWKLQKVSLESSAEFLSVYMCEETTQGQEKSHQKGMRETTLGLTQGWKYSNFSPARGDKTSKYAGYWVEFSASYYLNSQKNLL